MYEGPHERALVLHKLEIRIGPWPQNLQFHAVVVPVPSSSPVPI
jgi:hypothetical protein